MALCSVCKKNTAVVFVNKIVDGKPSLEGLCLSCAKDRGINPLASMMKQYGASEDDIANLNEQFNEIIGSISGDNVEFPEELANELNSEDGSNPFTSMFSNLFSSSESKPQNNEEKVKSSKKDKNSKKDKKRKTLETYGTNLTAKAREGKIDALIGRDTEIERMTQILNRRTKNNPVLIGEPGVGKTAIAEGLAIRIAEGKVPFRLKNKEIYLLDLTALVAGTQFRGQFESRIKAEYINIE